MNVKPQSIYPFTQPVRVGDFKPQSKGRLGSGLKFLLIVTAGLAHQAAGAESLGETPDNRKIDGNRLAAYDFTWTQCASQDGNWYNQGTMREQMNFIGEHVIQHRQTTTNPDGSQAVSTVFFDSNSFFPLRIEVTHYQAEGAVLGWAEFSLDDKGYSGRKGRGNEVKDVSGKLTSGMLHGSAMGLPLATLGWQTEPVTLLASMIGFDASYEVIATWAGKEEMQTPGGESVEAWLVDLEWHHRELGDVYPPGPDGSGGRFWIVPNPPEGFPYVPRYKTDTYAIEFVRQYCPGQKR